eukprot:PhM_4_TR11663/c1_g1_i1/m.64046
MWLWIPPTTTTADVQIVSPMSSTTVVTGLPLGDTNLTWRIARFAAKSESLATVTRIERPTASIGGAVQHIASNTTTLRAVLSDASLSLLFLHNFTTKWRVDSGAGEIISENKTNVFEVALRGAGVVHVSYLTQREGCSEAATATAVLTFPITTCVSAATTCNGNGVCDNVTGTCRCVDSAYLGHFDGLYCDRCAAGYTGYPSCTVRECVNHSTSCVHGFCNAPNGTCECTNDFTNGTWGGQTCDQCAQDRLVGFFTGSSCTECSEGFMGSMCRELCDANTTCNGHGVCSRSGCSCTRSDTVGHWAGPSCSVCAYPYFGDTCTLRCDASTTCGGHGMCSSLGCTCDANVRDGFYNTSFSLSSATATSVFCDRCQDSYGGPQCLRNLAGSCNTDTCIHGTCDANGNCNCTRNALRGHWDGVNCSICASDIVFGFWDGPGCDKCQDGYWGESCNKRCPHNGCSGRGECVTMQGMCLCNNSIQNGNWLGASAGCSVCMNSYYGPKCQRLCTTETCGPHGLCDENGYCTCHDDAVRGHWSGIGCSRCAGGRSIESGCTRCMTGRTGADCTTPLCDAAVSCNSHGTCDTTTNRCLCHNDTSLGHWDGADCSSCAAGWTGAICTTDGMAPRIGCEDGLLALSVVEVRFSDAFHTLDVVFNTTTDMANTYRANLDAKGLITDDTDCELYFTASVFSKLGRRPHCAWRDATNLIVYVGYDFGVIVADVVSIKSGVVLPTDARGSTKCSAPLSGTSMKVAPPHRVRSPQAIVSTTGSINFCSNVTLNAGATVQSSPRISFTYSVVSTTLPHKNQRLLLSNYLQTIDPQSQIIEVPSTYMPPSTVTYRVTATDEFTGLQSYTDVTVVKRPPSSPGPVIRRQTPSVAVVDISTTYTLRVAAEFNACDHRDPTRNMFYSWSVSPAVAWSTTGTHGFVTPVVVIPPFSLRPGVTYTFRAKVTDSDYNTDATSFSITGLTENLKALVPNVTLSTTSTPTVPILCDCEDPDNVTSVSETIVWSCALPSLCPTVLSDALRAIKNTRSVFLSVEVVSALLQNSTYPIRVTYTKGSRVTTADGYVSVSLEPQVSVVISGPSVTRTVSRTVLRTAVNATSLPGASLSYVWSCRDPCDFNLSAPSNTLQGTSRSTLVLMPNVLSAARSYIFDVVVSVSRGGGVIAKSNASFSLRVRTPPTGGALELLYDTADALSTNTLFARSWIAEEDALPLMYQFFVVDEEGREVPLSSSVRETRVDVKVQQSVGIEDVLLYRVVVRDQAGEEAYAEAPSITQRADAAKMSSYLSTSEQRLKRLGLAVDIEATLETLVLVGGIAASDENITNAPGDDNSGPPPTTMAASLLGTALQTLQSVDIDANAVPQVATATSLLLNAQPPESTPMQASSVASLALSSLSSIGRSKLTLTSSTSSDFASLVGSLAKGLATPLPSNKTAPESAEAAKAESRRNDIRTNIAVVDSLTALLTLNSVPGEKTSLISSELDMSCDTLGGEGEERNDGGDISADGNVGAVLCTTNWRNNNIFSAVSQDNVTSPVHSITLSGGGLGPGSNITFWLPTPGGSAVAPVVCAFFNFTSGNFSDKGCRVYRRRPSAVQCMCTHLTDFAIISPRAFLKPQLHIDVGNFSDIKIHGLIYVVLLTCIFIGLGIGGYMFDQYRQRRYIERHYITMREEAYRTKKLHHLEAQQHQPEDDGKSTPSHHEPRFPVTALSDISDTARKVSSLEERFSMMRFLRMGLTMHPWLAPLTASPRSAFTVPQRVALLACLTLSAFFFNGIFFASDSDPQQVKIVQYVWAVGAVSVTAPFIVFSVMFLFERTQRTRFDARNSYVPRWAQDLAVDARNRIDSDVLTSDLLPETLPAAFYDIPANIDVTEANTQNIKGTDCETMIGMREVCDFDLLYSDLRERQHLLCAVSTSMIRQRCAQTGGDPFEPSTYCAEVSSSADSSDDSTDDDLGEEQEVLDMSTKDRAPAAGDDAAHEPETSIIGSEGFLGLMDPVPVSVPHGGRNPLFDTTNKAGGDDNNDATSSNFKRAPRMPSMQRHAVTIALAEFFNKPYDRRDPFFVRRGKAPDETDGAADKLAPRLWGWESRYCAWRLAIECLVAHRWYLAECLFEIKLLLDLPDFLFVMHTTSVPHTLRDALEVVSLARMEEFSVGRAWAEYYAAVLLHISPAQYAALRSRSHERPSYYLMCSLLGLEHSTSYPAFGCVPYSLHVETQQPRRVTSSKKCEAEVSKSLVVAAHMFRLCGARNETSTSSQTALPNETPFMEVDSALSSATDQSQPMSVDAWLAAVRALEKLEDDDHHRHKHEDTHHHHHHHRHIAHRVRYSPYTTTDESPIMRSMPKALRERLRRDGQTHTDFRSTIEFGRFVTMLLYTREMMCGDNEFGAAFYKEEQCVLERGMRLGMSYHPVHKWDQVADAGRISSSEATGSNLHDPFAPCSRQSAYLTSWVNYHVTGVVSSRFVAPEGGPTLGLTALMMRNAPRMQGTGSAATPHFTWSSLEQAVRTRDLVILHSGTYRALSLSDIRGCVHHPIVFTSCAALRAHVSGPNNNLLAPDYVIQTEISVGEEAFAVVRLEDCSALRVVGITLLSRHDKCAHGAILRSCERVSFESCAIDAPKLVVHDGNGAMPIPRKKNYVMRKGTKALYFLSRVYPSSMVAVGWTYVFCLYALFFLFSLFVTSAMTDEEATEWVRRSSISIVLKVFVITPIVVALRVGLSTVGDSVGVDVGDMDLALE